MDEAVREDHPADAAHAGGHDPAHVDQMILEVRLADSFDEFHGQDPVGAQLGAQVGKINLRIGREIRLEAGVVGGLVGEVELLLDRVAEDLHRGAERHQPQRRNDALAGAAPGR
jgi:hypothetical protein